MLWGTVDVPAHTFKRNINVDEWFPVRPGDTSTRLPYDSVGEIRMSVKITETMIMYKEAYTDMGDVGQARFDSGGKAH